MRSDEHSTLATTDDAAAATPAPTYVTADLIADMRATFAAQTRTLLLALFATVLFNLLLNIFLVVVFD